MSFQVWFRWKAGFERPKKSINCLSFVERIWCWTNSWGAGPQVRMVRKMRWCLLAFLDMMSVMCPSVGPSRKCARIERGAHGEEWRVELQTIKTGADVLSHVVPWLDYINTEPFQAFHIIERLSETLFRRRNARLGGGGGGGQMLFQYFSSLRKVLMLN
jgi:hypothetical protein